MMVLYLYTVLFLIGEFKAQTGTYTINSYKQKPIDSLKSTVHV